MTNALLIPLLIIIQVTGSIAVLIGLAYLALGEWDW